MVFISGLYFRYWHTASIGHGMDDPRLIIDYHKDGVNVIIDYNGTRSEVTLTDSNSLLSEVRNLISGANVEILIIHNDPTE